MKNNKLRWSDKEYYPGNMIVIIIAILNIVFGYLNVMFSIPKSLYMIGIYIIISLSMIRGDLSKWYYVVWFSSYLILIIDKLVEMNASLSINYLFIGILYMIFIIIKAI